MKKLKLKLDVPQLSKNEMKQINGGYGDAQCYAVDVYDSAWQRTGGYGCWGSMGYCIATAVGGPFHTYTLTTPGYCGV